MTAHGYHQRPDGLNCRCEHVKARLEDWGFTWSEERGKYVHGEEVLLNVITDQAKLRRAYRVQGYACVGHEWIGSTPSSMPDGIYLIIGIPDTL